VSELLVAATNQGIVVTGREREVWQVQSRSLKNHRVNTLSVQKGTVLAGTRQGIFRSSDLGQTWQAASQGLTELHVRWLAHHPDGSGTVLAGTEPASLYLSHDGGQTWAERPEVAQLRDEHGWYLPYSPEAGCVRGFAFAAEGDRVYAAVEVGGLLRSDDGGETWRLVRGSSGHPGALPKGHIHPDVHSVVVHPSSPDLIFAPTGGGFYWSKDSGQTWEQSYRCYCRAVWADAQNAGHLVLGPADSVDRNGRIEMTHDGGETWVPASEGLEVPWPRHMVERFWQKGAELFAVLSNGELLSAPLATFAWQRILPQVEGVRALAFTSLD
jgi:photosystem II stability/assembly factor-like uncharacterized protein